MKDLILFFDTETSGLPVFKSRNSDPCQPYVLQLAAELCKPSGETIMAMNFILEPGNINPIHPKAFEAHGITREDCETLGIGQLTAFNMFMDLVGRASSIVAHNHQFDLRLIRIMAAQLSDKTDGLSRIQSDNFRDMPKQCTMMSTTAFCALPKPSGRGGYKWPKLEELHEILFGSPMSDHFNAHDALEDVRCTRKCYFELKTRGVL